MDDEYLALLFELHNTQDRQGPGGEAETELAISIALPGARSGDGDADAAGYRTTRRLRIADVGCGTGASALQLARSLDADITAVDFSSEFIATLEARAQAEGVSEKIEPLVCAMDRLPFADEELDVIWSEGAVYNLGFETGVKDWRRFIKPGGVLVVSEITWITETRPAELQAHWEAAYPEIDTASSKFRVLEESGYTPLGYFVLPESCWLDNYYDPLHRRLPEFLARHEGNEAAGAIAEAEITERALYEKYASFFSYGMYIARRLA